MGRGGAATSGKAGARVIRKLELLAPGGDLDAIRAAIVAGADAIYCGLVRFNARHRAANISLDELGGVVALAHRRNCRVFLTLNVMMVDSEIPALVGLLNRLVNTSLDGVIVQDLGLLELLSTRFPTLKVHASTQLTTHNEGQLAFLRRLGACRVNLCRELSLDELRPLVSAAQGEGLAVEVFVHGSHCVCFSGICYMSSVRGGRSANRGRCSQPCRARYVTTAAGRDFPLNLKDNSGYFDLEQLADVGVDALKIEGRMKTYRYVFTTTRAYQQRLQGLAGGAEPVDRSDELHQVFNRDFSNGYLAGEIGPQMFSDHPRNRSATRLAEQTTAASRDAAYDAAAASGAAIRASIEQISTAKAPLTLRISGRVGTPLRVAVDGPDTSFEVSSEALLTPQRPDSTVPPLEAEWMLQRLRAVNDTEYRIERLELAGLQPGLFVPLKELTAIKDRILFRLRGSREPIAAVELGLPAPRSQVQVEPGLAVLIAATDDPGPCYGTGAETHVLLPDHLGSRSAGLVALFQEHRDLVPWFPPVLIGEDYTAALSFLQRVQPARIVTDNSGVAYQAWQAGIPWIAGPRLNIANSFTLSGLQQRFACGGAFASSELSQRQLRRLNPPEGFELCYSIYHPIQLLISRQCLVQRVTGCDRDRLDAACLDGCERAATITDLQGDRLFVEKSKGSYCRLHHRVHFLNTAVVVDRPACFSSFLVDLRNVATETRTTLDRPHLVRLFLELVRGDAGAGPEVRRCIAPTTDALYRRGV